MLADDLDERTLWDDCREPSSQSPDRVSVLFDDPTWGRFDSEDGGWAGARSAEEEVCDNHDDCEA